MLKNPMGRRGFLKLSAGAAVAGPRAAATLTEKMAVQTTLGSQIGMASAAYMSPGVPTGGDTSPAQVMALVKSLKATGMLPDEVWEAFLDRYAQPDYMIPVDLGSLRSVTPAGLRAILRQRRHRTIEKQVSDLTMRDLGHQGLRKIIG